MSHALLAKVELDLVKLNNMQCIFVDQCTVQLEQCTNVQYIHSSSACLT